MRKETALFFATVIFSKKGNFLIRKPNSAKEITRLNHGDSNAKTLRFGIALCLISTLLYSFSNVTMRELGVMGLERSWIIFLKEMVCVGCILPYILYRVVCGTYHWPAWKWVLCILIGGTCCQFIGARLHLGAFATVGLVVSVPLIQASTMVCSSVLGRVLLHEKIVRRCMAAMLIMLVAMGCLVLGAKEPQPKAADDQVAEQGILTAPDEPVMVEPPHRETGQPVSEWVLLFGALGAIVAGLAYSIHIVCIRVSSNSRQMPISLIAVQVTGIGAIIFGFEFLRDHAWQMPAIWEGVSPRAWGLIILTGFLNMIGFLFQITGLRYTLVARAQMIAVAQIVIGTLFGIMAYDEMTNAMIWLGISLTVIGIYLASTPEKSELQKQE